MMTTSDMAYGKCFFTVLLTIAGGICLAVWQSAHALTFNFLPQAGTPQSVIDVFNIAGQRWSNIFQDQVMVNITVGFIDFTQDPTLSDNALGGASDFFLLQDVQYADVRQALMQNATSAADQQTLALLQPGPNYGRAVNRTADNPNGIGSPTPYVDNDGFFNDQVTATRANAKALGLLNPNDPTSDGQIRFNSAINWDFDTGDGINLGQFDLIGTATHEIGHILGFESFVDIIDPALIPCNAALVNCAGLSTFNGTNFVPAQNGDFIASGFFQATIMDLFRFSTDFGVGVPDIAVDNRDKFFPLLNGTLALFSNGVSTADGRQASHWRNLSPPIGIMDPSVASGVIQHITAADIELFEAIGWTQVAQTPDQVPEPSTVVLVATGCIGLTCLRRWRNRRRG